jgi:hypothetical protein
MRYRPVLLALAAALLVGGCGGGRQAARPGAAGTVNGAATARGPEAARTTALTEFGLLAGGDYGGAWDLWTAEARRVVPRADFVALGARCPRGVAAQPTGQTFVDDDTLTVDWKLGDRTGTARMVYTGGTWRYQPDQSTLDSYRQGRCAPAGLTTPS